MRFATREFGVLPLPSHAGRLLAACESEVFLQAIVAFDVSTVVEEQQI